MSHVHYNNHAIYSYVESWDQILSCPSLHVHNLHTARLDPDLLPYLLTCMILCVKSYLCPTSMNFITGHNDIIIGPSNPIPQHIQLLSSTKGYNMQTRLDSLVVYQTSNLLNSFNCDKSTCERWIT